MFKGDKKPIKDSSLVENDENMGVLNCSLCSYSCTEERNIKIHKSMKHKGKVTEEQDSIKGSTVKKNEESIFKCYLFEYSCKK